MQNRRSAAAIIADIDHILIEILLYVPSKSLIRFKSVSKHWLFLISDPHFSRLHTLRHRYRSTTTSALCLRRPPSRHYLIPLQQQRGPPRIQTLDFKLSAKSNYSVNPTPTLYTSRILQSCNGLLLLEICPNDQNSFKEYYVYNPATHQSRFLPPNSPLQNSCSNSENGSQGKSRILGLSLGYDPSKSIQYKVVCVKFAAFSAYSYEIEVYESETNCWKLANGGKEIAMPYDLILCDGVYWNGHIHWIRPKGDSFYFNLDSDCVVQCPGIPMQRRWWGDMGSSTYYFGNSNGHLHFVTMHKNTFPEAELRVFEMENDCSRWLLKYQMNFKDILYHFPEMRKTGKHFGPPALDHYAFCLFGLIREENDDGSILVFHVPGKVIGYKLRDRSFVELADLRTADFYREGYLQFGCGDAYMFIETLVTV